MPLNDTQIYVDDSNFVAFVEGMKSKRVRSLEKSALRKAGNMMKSAATKSLKRVKGNVINKSKRKSDWYNGIRMSVQEDKEKRQFWQVHILGFYILKWLEMGTEERRTKKSRGNSYQKRTLDTNGSHLWVHKRGTSPHATGKMKPIWWFRDAAAQNKEKLVEKMQIEWRNIIVKEFIKNNGI